MTRLEVSFKPHPVNGWWLRMFTDPYVAVDGTVAPCTWSDETTVDAPAGHHEVRTFVRYRRVIPGDRGSGTVTLQMTPDQALRIQARNGLTNGSPFTPHVVSPSDR